MGAPVMSRVVASVRVEEATKAYVGAWIKTARWVARAPAENSTVRFSARFTSFFSVLAVRAVYAKAFCVIVPVAVRLARVRSPEKSAFPCTAKVAEGVVVATPTLPPRVARYTELVAVNCVVEAFANCCNALQVLALLRLSDATTSPVVGEMVREPSELATEETTPLRHDAPTLKQPPVSWMPFAKVEVAKVEVIFNRFA